MAETHQVNAFLWTESGHTHGGIPVRVLRSLSAIDQWHFENAFVGSLRAAEAYLYSHAAGYAGHFVANARGG